MDKQMHLNLVMLSMPVNHTVGMWAEPVDQHFDGLSSFAYWQDLAKALESACFDAIFFADVAAASAGYQGGQEAAIRYGVNWPAHDPMPLIAAMAAATRRLGFIVTLSTTGHQPYLAVRRLSTLDYLTRGRIGWNLVTGANKAEHAAIGGVQLEHDERYDAADEFLDICYRLWGSIDEDVLVLDRKTRIFADPSKIRRVDYKGKYYSCTAYVPTLPSPQGHPVIFQAGSSGRGMAFAAQHAEGVFAIQTGLSGMQRYMAQAGEAAQKANRRIEDLHVTFGLQAVLGGTEAEAHSLARRQRENVPLEGALARLSSIIGIDFSQYDPDGLFEEIPAEGSQGLLRAFAQPIDGHQPTLRQVAQNYGVAAGAMRVVGTPEQVACEMERLWRATGCHGFNLSATDSPQSVYDFTREVIPILQRKGVYRTEYPGATLRENITTEPALLPA
ncbi:MAG: NtaA/DmoA family FMN-dependent monooxygenase [Proteobacteria bacterium]|nr:NtaA/DmoA family FMN-dependent monooxygenase [Pseudomonadota bacterium]